MCSVEDSASKCAQPPIQPELKRETEKRPAESERRKEYEMRKGQEKEREIENSCSYLSSFPSEEPRGRWEMNMEDPPPTLISGFFSHLFLLNASVILFLSLLPSLLPQLLLLSFGQISFLVLYFCFT